ncbi:hypothetical protein DBADOPDK_05726 [Pseudomonas sp. MM223]|nr:hypothetical protein DBADOPDK_05726 [Pseudomonas sp. MM223]
MNCVETAQPSLPAALPANACFAIVAPAGAARLDTHKVSQWFVDRGYRCRIYPGALQAQGYLAGPDQQRLQDLHDAFADPAIDAILCMRGGYGSMRLLDQLDFELIRHNPKPLIGYSDITALHTAIYRHSGLVTFHGGMLNADLLGAKLPPTESSLLAQLGGHVRTGEQIVHPADHALSSVLPGVASGPLLGGNLSMLGASMGTLAEPGHPGLHPVHRGRQRAVVPGGPAADPVALGGQAGGDQGRAGGGLCRDYHSGVGAVAGGHLCAAGSAGVGGMAQWAL